MLLKIVCVSKRKLLFSYVIFHRIAWGGGAATLMDEPPLSMGISCTVMGTVSQIVDIKDTVCSFVVHLLIVDSGSKSDTPVIPNNQL
jgi:hypothetical protein